MRSLILVCIAVVGLVAGVVLGGDLLDGSAAPSTEPSTDASGRVDILHDPPLIYPRGTYVSLRFDLVCAGDPCGPAEGRLVVRGEDGSEWAEQQETDDLSLEFAVPASVSTEASFDYRLDVTLGDGRATSFPSGERSAVMKAVAADEASIVELPAIDAAEQRIGELVVSGPWGTGPSEFGRSSESGSGPRSFDVARDGSVVIVDRYNDRFVRVDPKGGSTTLPAELDPGENDIALGPDGTIDLLYASGGSGARLVQYGASGGKATGEIPLATASADSVQRIGSDTIAVEGDDSWWYPVERGGEPVAVDDQARLAQPGLWDDDSLVVRKHLREKGNEVWVAERTDARVRAWRITGKDPLGPVELAAPLPDGRVVAVQSQFTNRTSQLVVLLLDTDGVEQLVIPDDRAADTYVRLRLVGSELYEARTTDADYSIWRYDLTPRTPSG